MTGAELDADTCVPRFRRGVKLRFDQARGNFVLLAPEKAFVPDDIAAQILQQIDGQRSLGAIAADLAKKFGAPLDLVTRDIIATLTNLADRGAIDL